MFRLELPNNIYSVTYNVPAVKYKTQPPLPPKKQPITPKWKDSFFFMFPDILEA